VALGDTWSQGGKQGGVPGQIWDNNMRGMGSGRVEGNTRDKLNETEEN
jgi:hypothetical protein